MPPKTAEEPPKTAPVEENTGKWIQKENEIAVAEMELRMRKLTIQILQPSIDKYAIMLGELENLKNELRTHAVAFQEVIIMRGQMDELREFTSIVRDEIEQRDLDNRTFQKNTQDKLASISEEGRDCRRQIDQSGSKIQFLQREVERRGQEIKALQTGFEEVRHDMEREVDELNEKHKRSELEIKERLDASDAGQQYLVDELWGEDKGLKKVEADIRGICKSISVLPDLMEGVQRSNDRMDVVEGKMNRTETFLIKAETSMKDLQSAFTSQTEEMRVKLKESTNQYAATHSAMMADLRSQQQLEYGKVRELRTDVEKFVTSATGRISTIEGELSSLGNSWQALHKEVRGDIEELNKKRKRDKLCADLEFKEVKKYMIGTTQQFQPVWKTVEHLSSVMSIVVEAAKVDAALSIQDYSDRRQTTWLGSTSDLPRPMKPLEGLKGLLAAKSDKSWGTPKDDVVDLRKVSKLKRFSYTPGNVLFGDTQYERPDLIQILQRLLEKAGGALEHGPSTTSDKGFCSSIPEHVVVDDVARSSSGLPNLAKPSTFDSLPEIEEVNSEKVPESWSDVKESLDTGKMIPRRSLGSRSGSRPGSMGQPGAVGSRGRGDAVGGLDLPTIPSLPGGPPGVGGLDLPPLKAEPGAVPMTARW